MGTEEVCFAMDVIIVGKLVGGESNHRHFSMHASTVQHMHTITFVLIFLLSCWAFMGANTCFKCINTAFSALENEAN